jgi:hypothetical protein
VHPEIRQLGRADRRMLAPPLAPTESSASVAKGSRAGEAGGTLPVGELLPRRKIGCRPPGWKPCRETSRLLDDSGIGNAFSPTALL